MGNTEIFSEIKKVGWSAIQLNKRGYRGAIQAYKNVDGMKVPVMFYIDECFVIEDSEGLFKVEDLKDGGFTFGGFELDK